MVGTGSQKLYIYTFGKLLIRKGDKTLFSGNKKLNKRWKLFLFLLCRRGETVSDQELIRELNLTENATPRQSLRALVYRLRKEIGTDNNHKSYIYTERGGYGFNPESIFWLDCQKFKQLIIRAKKEESNLKIKYYRKALDLYEGPFLNNHSLENGYLIQQRKNYRDQYLHAVNKTAYILMKKEFYEQLVDIYEVSLQMYPMSMDLYLGLINTLKKAGKPDLARIRAEEAISILRNSDIEVPDKLEKEISNSLQEGFNKDPELAFTKSRKESEQVFECGPLTFFNIYDLEKRRSERNNFDIYLIHFKLSNGSSPEQMNEAEKMLKTSLRKYLRSSDVITRWEPRHYIQLAVSLSVEEIEKILHRIEIKYEEQFPPSEISLTYEYQKI